MHELSIAMAIVEQATEIAAKEDATGVKRVALTVGELAGVDEHALRAAFPIATENTPIEGASLDVEFEAASVYCNDCREEITVTPPLMVCGTCYGSNVDIRKGRDMIIRELDLIQASEISDA